LRNPTFREFSCCMIFDHAEFDRFHKSNDICSNENSQTDVRNAVHMNIFESNDITAPHF
jgi:hypothetical protein